jgi:ATP-binding cassette subfamily F protein uup
MIADAFISVKRFVSATIGKREEDYLSGFKGCVIVVSHDRYFTDKVAEHLLVFHGKAQIQEFPGNYTQYRLWKAQNIQTDTIATSSSSGKTHYRQSPDKKKRTFKEQKELESLEIEIPELEAEKKAIEEALNSGSLTFDEINQKSICIGEFVNTIEEKTIRWLELSEIGNLDIA